MTVSITDSASLEVTEPRQTRPGGKGATTSAGPPGATILPIETPTLGDRSYLVHDGRVAIVIDPQRDIDRVLDLAGAAGVRITHIFETHIHNDYVTGGLALARETGAAYHVDADDPVASMTSPSRSAAGYRASIAMSILLARGHRVIAIDDDYTNDDYTNAGAAGLPLTAGDHERNGR